MGWGVCERALKLRLSRKDLTGKAKVKTGIGKSDLPGLQGGPRKRDFVLHDRVRAPRLYPDSLPPYDSKLVSVFPSEIWSQTPNGTTEGLPVRSPSDEAQKWKPSSAV